MWNNSFLSLPSGRLSLPMIPRTENWTTPWLTVGICQRIESFLPVTRQPSGAKDPPFDEPWVPPRRESSRISSWDQPALDASAANRIARVHVIVLIDLPP